MNDTIVQIALDVTSIDKAVRLGEIAVKVGADWLEAGTPLITFEGVEAIGALAREFPQVPIVADYKSMDGVAKYVEEAGRQGASIATVCAVTSDASVREAVRAGRESKVKIVADLLAVSDLVRRAQEVAGLGVDYVMVHLGADEIRERPTEDPLTGLSEVVEAVDVPVGVGTFNAGQAVEAVKKGARFIVQGNPLLSSDNMQKALGEFIERVKSVAR